MYLSRTKKSFFHFSSQKGSRKFHCSKAKISFFHIPSFPFSPGWKWKYKALQEWVSAWDKRHVNWFLLFSFFPILWQERKQAEEDSIPTAKRKRRETKEIKRKIFQDLFFIVTGQEKVPQNAYRSRFVHSALPDSSLACKRDGGQRWENFVNWLSGYKISIVYEWRFALT